MSKYDPEEWMWERARDLLDEADRLQKQFFRPGTAVRRPAWQPPVDIFETPQEIWILVALPGVEADRLQVSIDEATVTVSGTRSLPPAFRCAVVERLEIPHGRFERSVTLPAGRYELITRKLELGCLVLTLKKLG